MPTQQDDPTTDAAAIAEATEQPGSTEDAVRRLLDGESGSGTLSGPVVRAGSAPVNAPDHTPGKPTIVSRMAEGPKRMARDTWERGQAAVMSYRPDPRHMALLLLVIIVFSMPWLVPTLLLLGLMVLLISYLTLGHDRASELVSNWYDWLARRNPQGAEVLRSRAERVSARLSAWAEYLPERWTSGLYLPDFSHSDETPDNLADDPFDRLIADPQNR